MALDHLVGADLDLSDFDGLCVRITNVDGEIYDGICTFCNSEFCEHEYGCAEDCLDIMNFIFYKSDIQKIESLEAHAGPYGKFLDPYGRLEEKIVEDGIDSIEDALACEENVHIMRILRCLDVYLDPNGDHEFTCREETLEALRELMDTTEDAGVREAAETLISKYAI